MTTKSTRRRCILVALCLVNQENIGDKGKKIYEEIEKAKRIFFEDLGVIKINNECDRLRRNFLSAVEQDRVFGFVYDKQQFLEELRLPFELKEPEKIEVELLNKETANRCMETYYQGPISSLSFGIRVYLEKFKEENGEFVWDSDLGYDRFCISNGCVTRTEHVKRFTVRTAVFHEFLRTCGEIPEFGRKDGVIRPNIIGLNAILGLLERNSER